MASAHNNCEEHQYTTRLDVQNHSGDTVDVVDLISYMKVPYCRTDDYILQEGSPPPQNQYDGANRAFPTGTDDGFTIFSPEAFGRQEPIGNRSIDIIQNDDEEFNQIDTNIPLDFDVDDIRYHDPIIQGNLAIYRQNTIFTPNHNSTSLLFWNLLTSHQNTHRISYESILSDIEIQDYIADTYNITDLNTIRRAIIDTFALSLDQTKLVMKLDLYLSIGVPKIPILVNIDRNTTGLEFLSSQPVDELYRPDTDGNIYAKILNGSYKQVVRYNYESQAFVEILKIDDPQIQILEVYALDGTDYIYTTSSMYRVQEDNIETHVQHDNLILMTPSYQVLIYVVLHESMSTGEIILLLLANTLLLFLLYGWYNSRKRS